MGKQEWENVDQVCRGLFSYLSVTWLRKKKSKKILPGQPVLEPETSWIGTSGRALRWLWIVLRLSSRVL